ncbi:hypothetical protein PIB30_102865, partial [Stylosanthes scabra]|nr:hypothetical protein [Stylosanthes scabra]
TPCICVGLAVLWNVAASSTHKRGLPRLCVGHLILDRAELFFHGYALLRRMCAALKTLGRTCLPFICVLSCAYVWLWEGRARLGH